MIDLNRTGVRERAASEVINALVDSAISAEPREPRIYLGASALGSDCLRKIQWDWREPAGFEPRTYRIFARGHWAEGYSFQCLRAGGFKIVQGVDRIAFKQLDGMFRGHGDGLVVDGPPIEGMGYPCLWEHKGLGSKGWTKLQKEGLAKVYPAYADQVALYQAYFDLADHPALFTALNMDTMEMLHLLIPFDPERAQAASDRAVIVIKATQAGETLPRVASTADDFRCRFCSHKARCWA